MLKKIKQSEHLLFCKQLFAIALCILLRSLCFANVNGHPVNMSRSKKIYGHGVSPQPGGSDLPQEAGLIWHTACPRPGGSGPTMTRFGNAATWGTGRAHNTRGPPTRASPASQGALGKDTGAGRCAQASQR